MNASWLPHWMTLVALGCGLAGLLYPKLPSASKGPEPRNFQEKHLEDIASIVGYGLILLSLTVLATLGILIAIFLALGWSRSPGVWNVMGAISFLWIIGRLGRIWQRLPVSKGAPRTTDPALPPTLAKATNKAKPADGEASHQ